MSPELCRGCLSPGATRSLFDLSQRHRMQLHRMMSALAAVEVRPDDEYPKYICEMCFRDLNLAYSFKKRCEEVERQLKDKASAVSSTLVSSEKKNHILIKVESEFENDTNFINEDSTACNQQLCNNEYVTDDFFHKTNDVKLLLCEYNENVQNLPNECGKLLTERSSEYCNKVLTKESEEQYNKEKCQYEKLLSLQQIEEKTQNSHKKLEDLSFEKKEMKINTLKHGNRVQTKEYNERCNMEKRKYTEYLKLKRIEKKKQTDRKRWENLSTEKKEELNRMRRERRSKMQTEKKEETNRKRRERRRNKEQTEKNKQCDKEHEEYLRLEKIEKKKQRDRDRWKNLTPEQIEKRKQKDRKRWKTLSIEKKEELNRKRREIWINLTPEQQENQRQKWRIKRKAMKRDFCYICQVQYTNYSALLQHIAVHVTSPSIILYRINENITGNSIEMENDYTPLNSSSYGDLSLNMINIKTEYMQYNEGIIYNPNETNVNTRCETEIEIDDVSVYTHIKKEIEDT